MPSSAGRPTTTTLLAPTLAPMTVASLPSLSGYTVAITADRRWDEQAALLERRGATVVHAPVIRTLPLVDAPALRAATEALVAVPPDIVGLSTGLGTRSWFSAAEGVGLADALLDALRPARVLARGPKAAGAALTVGLDVDWKAPTARAAELVAELRRAATERDPTSVRVAVQLDGGPEPRLADEIAALGYDVVPVPVYRWSLPADRGPAERLVANVADRNVDAVTFTAAHAVANFFELAATARRTDEVVAAFNSGEVAAVCVGPVCGERAVELGLRGVVVPVHPRLGAMVQSCVNAFVDRSREFPLGGHAVRVQGRVVAVGREAPVQLSERERDVLRVLARKPAAVVPKAALLKEVWGDAESDEHLVEVTVARLRHRLGAAGAGVETVVRRGYRLAPD